MIQSFRENMRHAFLPNQLKILNQFVSFSMPRFTHSIIGVTYPNYFLKSKYYCRNFSLAPTEITPIMVSRKAYRKAKATERRKLKRKNWKKKRLEQQEAKRIEREKQWNCLSDKEKSKKKSLMKEAKIEKLKIQAHQHKKLQDALTNELCIAIDLSYSGLMNNIEIKSLVNQLEYSYGVNKRSTRPVALTLTNLGSASNYFSSMFSKRKGHKWQVNLETKPLWELYSPDDIIYLSPDSNIPMKNIDNSKVYCIGGFVDRTIQKHASLNHARFHNIPVFRLPIREMLPYRISNENLTIDTVVKILLHYREHGKWDTALANGIPDRKRYNYEKMQKSNKNKF